MNTSTTSVVSQTEATIDVRVFDADGITPTSIIRTNQKWYVRLEWRLSDRLAETLDGTWHLRGYLEGFGSSDEMELWDKTMPIVNGEQSYSETIEIAPDRVYMGTYRLLSTISHRQKDGSASPIAFFDESPILQFYDSGFNTN
jgi:hypothetical protein